MYLLTHLSSDRDIQTELSAELVISLLNIYAISFPHLAKQQMANHPIRGEKAKIHFKVSNPIEPIGTTQQLKSLHQTNDI